MSRLFKRATLILIVVISIVVATGCWQDQDIEERALVAAVGIDQLPDEMIEITLQIVKTDAAAEASEAGPTEKAVWVYSTTGKTVFEAIRNQLKSLNQKPFFGHNQVIVIGEEMARNGIKDIIDVFERDPEIKLTPLVLIAKGTTAKTILNATSELEPIPIVHIKDILENFEGNPVIQRVQAIDLLQQLNKKGHQLTVGTTECVRNEDKANLSILDLRIEGSAAFKGDQLIGWLTPEQTNGLHYIDNKIKSGVINIPVPNEEDKIVAIERVKSLSKVKLELKGEQLEIIIDVKSRGALAGQQGGGNLANPEMLEMLEAECEEAIKSKIEDVVQVAQNDFKSDILGFGEIIRRDELSVWRKIQKNWDETFPTIPVKINVKFKILRTGLTNKPLEIQ